jgi:IS30 family transposase
MPRPRKELTPEDITQVERLAAVLNLEQIADYLGISDSTLRRRMQENPDVMEAYKKGRATAAIGIGTSLLQQAREGNITAMIFYAKTQMGWRETQHIEANVTNGNFVLDLVGDDDASKG